MKVRPSTKIAIGFATLLAVGFGGSKLYTQLRLSGVKLDPILSEDFCLVAISEEAKVKILSVNRMVQIVEASDEFKSSGSGGGGGADSGSIKARVPMKELLAILDGDAEGTTGLLYKLAKKENTEEPSEEAPIWSTADAEKALAGDPVLKAKLESDLNVSLDGKLPAKLNRTAFYHGIRLKVPITFEISNASGKPVQGFNTVPLKSKAMSSLYKELESKFLDADALDRFYAEYVAKNEGKSAENPADLIKSLLASGAKGEGYRKAINILKHAQVITNRKMIESAEVTEVNSGKESSYDLSIHLTDEGAARLWKFSSEHPNTKIIVVSKKVPIAAATVGTQLNSKELVIKQIADKTLVQEAVDLVKSR
ncbi:MAG: hypothetical protein CBB60_002890 [Armatimonadetes bacterium Cent15-Ar3]|nr:MAG: hypothetical protein CBB60_002890 [Armatimonadetes bacterium Cent15-Ar3]